MLKFKKILKCIIFLAICITINAFIKFALIPPSYARVILHELNESNQNYDCVILGASHSRSGINPYIIDKKIDVNSLNLSIPSESIQDSYYLLKESYRNNSPKTVILDLDYQYWYNLVKSDYGATFIYDQLDWTPVKFDYMFNNLLNKDFRVGLSRWANYTYLVTNVKSNLNTKLSSDYANYSVNSVNNKDAGGPYVGKGFFYREQTFGGKGSIKKNSIKWNSAKVDAKALKYFNKIVKYCKDNNIKLICVTSPITPATLLTGPYNEIHDYFKQLCEQKNVDYYDFNLVKPEKLPVTNVDFVDYDGHMCGKLADKYTEILGDVIAKAQTGDLDKNEYFYSTFKEYLDNLKEITLLEMDLVPGKVDDNTYSVSFKVLGSGGTNTVPEYKVIITNFDTGEVVLTAEYSDKVSYYYEFPPNSYTVTVYARGKGSNIEYDEVCKKSIELREQAVQNYCAK